MAAMQLTRTHRILIGVVITGAVVIAAIGFAGSYSAVRELALKKGFGNFAYVFPIGIDAGICVLLALDLLLTWMRIPFPLLRQSAWILTAATIAFNGAAAWPDPLGVGMHAVIPLLFIVAVEAARHAVGRIADITADKHMEGVRVTRWLLSPVPTFMLWRRMKLWELRSYEQVIKLEQDRLIYQSRLQARFGRNWRRKAPVESMMPLRLAKYGVPLADTAPAGLAAAGVEPMLLPPAPVVTAELPPGQGGIPAADATRQPQDQQDQQDQQGQQQDQGNGQGQNAQQQPQHQGHQQQQGQQQGPQGPPGPQQSQQGPQGQQGQQQGPPRNNPQDPAQAAPANSGSPWFATPHVAPEAPYEGSYNPAYDEGLEPGPVTVPYGAGGRTRPLGGAPIGVQGPRREGPYQAPEQQNEAPVFEGQIPPEAGFEDIPVPPGQESDEVTAPGLPDDLSRVEAYHNAFRKYVSEHQDFPNARQFGLYLMDLYGITGRSGGPLTEGSLRGYLREFRNRYQTEMDADSEHIA
ncbi:DUF2637 domain-containing protein [Streptomyces sp. NPDC088725]|uniref:DUF2637 domain-containing protein n=1 Tax=Streptomyces sp. NPDC088725 TaxID=3365873 RepID=UPI00380797DC